MKSIYVALFIALASVFIASCGGSDDPQVDVAGALVTETPNISVEQKEPEIGCKFDNPSCNTTTQICQNNECVPKPGCQNNNPSCTFGQFCQNNKCIGTATGVIGHPEKNDMWGELQTVEESGVDLVKQK